MKTSFLLGALGLAIYLHHGPAKPAATTGDARPLHSSHQVVAKQIVIAPAPTASDRWKTGANAFTDLKTGADAQVHWEPFLPDEQATWNQNPGYSIVSSTKYSIRPTR